MLAIKLVFHKKGEIIMADLKDMKVTVKQILGVLAMTLTMFVLSNFNDA